MSSQMRGVVRERVDDDEAIRRLGVVGRERVEEGDAARQTLRDDDAA